MCLLVNVIKSNLCEKHTTCLIRTSRYLALIRGIRQKAVSPKIPGFKGGLTSFLGIILPIKASINYIVIMDWIRFERLVVVLYRKA